MVGYSFSHQFDDTFTVRQNLRFADQNLAKRFTVLSDGKQRQHCTGAISRAISGA
jgi:hypothetical protein